MINDQVILLTYMQAQSDITDITTTARIHAARDMPPTGYTPDDGSAIVFKRRGLLAMDERGQAYSGSYQVKCYGRGGNDNQQRLNAEALYRGLHDAMQFGQNYDILGIQQEAGPEPLEEPDTGWPYVLSFWRVQFRKTA